MKKKNFIKIIFSAILGFFKKVLLFLQFKFLYLCIKPFVRCKVKGKKNVRKDDEGRVFIFNHYEIYGPIATYLRFPYNFKPWVIDKIMEPETVQAQMSISIYNNFPKYPRWFKTLAIHFLKNLLVFAMKYAGAISVSRENLKDNIKCLQESVKCLDKGKNIAIYPELSYVQEGLGEFQSGFEHLGKYYYQKTGKCVTFYPVFISQSNKEMYIEPPIKFNPNVEPQLEKEKIMDYVYNSMYNSYIKNELSKPIKKTKK